MLWEMINRLDKWVCLNNAMVIKIKKGFLVFSCQKGFSPTEQNNGRNKSSPVHYWKQTRLKFNKDKVRCKIKICKLKSRGIQ